MSQIPVPPKPQIAWHKLTAEQIDQLYTSLLEEASRDLLVKHGAEQLLVADTNVCDVPVEILDTFETDVVIREMRDKITRTRENLPHSKFNKKLKPYWSDLLSTLSKNKKDIWLAWLRAGKPRDNDNCICVNYQRVKQEIRRERRGVNMNMKRGVCSR